MALFSAFRGCGCGRGAGAALAAPSPPFAASRSANVSVLLFLADKDTASKHDFDFVPLFLSFSHQNAALFPFSPVPSFVAGGWPLPGRHRAWCCFLSLRKGGRWPRGPSF